jgi:hypothetical protein
MKTREIDFSGKIIGSSSINALLNPATGSYTAEVNIIQENVIRNQSW